MSSSAQWGISRHISGTVRLSRTTSALRTCSNPVNVPGTRASIVLRIYHAVRSTPFGSDLAFSCMGPKMKSFPLKALVQFVENLLLDLEMQLLLSASSAPLKAKGFPQGPAQHPTTRITVCTDAYSGLRNSSLSCSTDYLFHSFSSCYTCICTDHWQHQLS